MVRFTTISEFDAHVAKTHYPRLLIISARARMEGVEECNQGGRRSLARIRRQSGRSRGVQKRAQTYRA